MLSILWSPFHGGGVLSKGKCCFVACFQCDSHGQYFKVQLRSDKL